MQNYNRTIDLLEVVETQRYARLQRQRFGWQNLARVDLLSLERISKIWTVRGLAPFSLRFAADGREEPCTKLEGSRLVVEVSPPVRERALFGDGKARFSIAAEIGNVTLGHYQLLEKPHLRYREDYYNDDARRVLAQAYRSTIFLAGVFAAALLIDEETARALPSDDEIAAVAGIDILCARKYYHDLPGTVSQSHFPTF